MSRLYQPTAVLALVLFVGLAALHIAVLLGFPAPSVVSAFTIFPFVFAGQLIAIHGLNGGTLRGARGRFNPVRQLRLGLAGLRYIPVAWRIFGLPFWYLYMPATFFWHMSHMMGQLHEVNGEFVLTEHGRALKTLTATQAAAARANEFLLASVVLLGFLLAHFLLLRFIVPNRDKILADVPDWTVTDPLTVGSDHVHSREVCSVTSSIAGQQAEASHGRMRTHVEVG